MNNQNYPHLILEIDPEYGDIHISEARHWVKNPITGEKETIEKQWMSQSPIYCPNCHARENMQMTTTEKHIIVSCNICNKHCWCQKERREVNTIGK